MINGKENWFITTEKKKNTPANPLLPSLPPLLHPVLPHPVEVFASGHPFIVGRLYDLQRVPLLSLGDAVDFIDQFFPPAVGVFVLLPPIGAIKQAPEGHPGAGSGPGRESIDLRGSGRRRFA